MIKKAKELYVKTSDQAGRLFEVSSAIAGAGVNIEAICGYACENQAHFMILTSNPAKARNALKKAGFEVSTNDVVVTELPDKPGTLAQAGKKLADAGLSLEYAYGSAGTGKKALLVLAGPNLAQVAKALASPGK